MSKNLRDLIKAVNDQYAQSSAHQWMLANDREPINDSHGWCWASKMDSFRKERHLIDHALYNALPIDMEMDTPDKTFAMRYETRDDAINALEIALKKLGRV